MKAGVLVQVRVLLASTKAAGTGLNLTCACRVLILDVWWTWAHEDQVRCLPEILFLCMLWLEAVPSFCTLSMLHSEYSPAAVHAD